MREEDEDMAKRKQTPGERYDESVRGKRKRATWRRKNKDRLRSNLRRHRAAVRLLADIKTTFQPGGAHPPAEAGAGECVGGPVDTKHRSVQHRPTR